jgi:hypothetical protein
MCNDIQGQAETVKEKKYLIYWNMIKEMGKEMYVGRCNMNEITG